ncbi:hypothetical protein [Sphingobium phenoxybenzoativorans]|jgi:hypothetical protein|nr:hypothetical protein [Sphingobium phenoxybenzoativorans]
MRQTHVHFGMPDSAGMAAQRGSNVMCQARAYAEQDHDKDGGQA